MVRFLIISMLAVLCACPGCATAPLTTYEDGRPNPQDHLKALIAEKKIILGQSTTSEVLETLAAAQANRPYRKSPFFDVLANVRTRHLALGYSEPVWMLGFDGIRPLSFTAARRDGETVYLMMTYNDSLQVTGWSFVRSGWSFTDQLLGSGLLESTDYPLVFGDHAQELVKEGYLDPRQTLRSTQATEKAEGSGQR